MLSVERAFDIHSSYFAMEADAFKPLQYYVIRNVRQAGEISCKSACIMKIAHPAKPSNGPTIPLPKITQ